MNKFSKIGISALLSLLTLSTASAMNPPQEDTLSENNSISEDIPEDNKNEALKQAIQNRNLNVVEKIIPNATADQLSEALDLALDLDNVDIFKTILEYINNDDRYLWNSPIDEGLLINDAAEYNKPKVFEYLVYLEFRERNEAAYGSLCLAASKGHINIIEIFKKAYDGDDFNPSDYDGIDYLSEALIEAAKHNHKDVISFLTKNFEYYKSNINILEKALIEVAKQGNEDVIYFLIKNYNEYYKSSNSIGKAIYYNFLSNNNNNNNIFMFLLKQTTLKDIGAYLEQAHINKYPIARYYITKNKVNLKNIALHNTILYTLKRLKQENPKLVALIKTDDDFKNASIEISPLLKNCQLLIQIKNELNFGFDKTNPSNVDYFGKLNLNHLNPNASPDAFKRTPAQLNELKEIINSLYRKIK